ncbi:MAG: nucleotidyltransferase domain-containing protein [Paludibacter sp.]|nr:nucleotidyltransferase domain-containing protein [Paludibacter sp.]MDD4198103.1 nucleotidyltransferase domain-containing protein [Paludibacter sp.]MDD4427685.1 nucleotidyltransferase domain-containing protein [Paludibacter sp.]
MQNILENKKDAIRQICRMYGVKRLYAFGSVVSDKFRNDSDIDFLISFPDDLSVDDYTNNYFSLHYKLRDLLQREIDIVTERTLSNPYFIESINASKELIYKSGN